MLKAPSRALPENQLKSVFHSEEHLKAGLLRVQRGEAPVRRFTQLSVRKASLHEGVAGSEATND